MIIVVWRGFHARTTIFLGTPSRSRRYATDDTPLSASRLLGLLVGIIVIALVYTLPQAWVTNHTSAVMTDVFQFIASVLPLLLFVAHFRYAAKESITKRYKRLKWRDLGFGLAMT